ncbi:hypothetical protein BVX97_04055 [bacterium E08(2017)]|nr:hypothetical protein BVX97_04055 [bacterium E08(2017)]
MNRKKIQAGHKLWQSSSEPFYRSFVKSLSDCKEVQEKMLLRIVQSNYDSEYGNLCNFREIDSVESFRKNVPLSSYSDYKPYIQRIMMGEKKLLTSEPVLLLEPSGGSTSASKLIPYTQALRQEFQSGIHPWLYDLYEYYPDISNGRMYWSISPSLMKQSFASQVPVGFDDDASYLGETARTVFPDISVTPDVHNALDMEQFREITMQSLTLEHDLSLISVWSPSFLRILFDWYLDKQKIRDKSFFAGIWSNLQVVSCWTCADSRLEADLLKEYLPHTEIQGKGLIATEAFVSLPFAGYEDPVLSICSHFFEFESEDGEILLANELDKGKTYSVIVTTGGGFYRYRVGDMVLVTGYAESTPLLRFIGKKSMVSDRRGEKLNAHHVAEVLEKVIGGRQCSFYMMAPDYDGDDLAYTVYVEGNNIFEMCIADQVESLLQHNPHYQYCSALGQVQRVRVFQITHDAVAAYEQRCIEKGQTPGDIKLMALSKYDGWSEYFKGDYV